MKISVRPSTHQGLTLFTYYHTPFLHWNYTYSDNQTGLTTSKPTPVTSRNQFKLGPNTKCKCQCLNIFQTCHITPHSKSIRCKQETGTLDTTYIAYKTTICGHLDWNCIFHRKQSTNLWIVNLYSTCSSPRQTSPHCLLMFELFTLSRHLKNHAICQQLFTFICYHTKNVICRNALIYNHFKTTLCLIYSF